VADTTVDTTADTFVHGVMALWGPYWINTTTGVIVFMDSSDDVVFTRTTDGGANWTKNGTALDTDHTRHMAAWFDQETPGDSGTLIHVSWLESTTNDAHYRTIDISDGSLGTLRTIDSTVTPGATGDQNRIAITKARNGVLLMAFLTSTEIECYRSADSGANWTGRADVYETIGEEDHVLFFPANVDDGDVAALYWDKSTESISVKMYDDSADTWNETAILSSMKADTVDATMDGSVRHSDGFILGCAHSDDDDTTDDLRTWTVNPNSIMSPPIDTSTANIFTNQVESSAAALFINQQNDDVYVSYLKGGTWLTSVDCVYHKSTDDMSSWDSESAYSQAAADNNRRVQAGRTVGNDGGFYQPVWFNDDLLDLFVNVVNDVAIGAAGGDSPITPTIGAATLAGVGGYAVGLGLPVPEVEPIE